jgi:membrane fusion protein, multidrug efflux system
MMFRNLIVGSLVVLSASALLAQGGQAVDVTPVIARPVVRTRTLPGEFLPFESVAIYARVSGYVSRVMVDRGSNIRRGQTLASIEAPEIASQRAEAEARLAGARSQEAEAQAKLAAAQNTYEGLKLAAKTKGAVADNELLQAQKAVDGQQAVATSVASHAKAAAAAVDAIRQLESYLTITAPFDGVITERNVHPGALVGPQSGGGAPAMLRLEQTRRLRLVVPLPEAEVGAIMRGANVEFTVPAYPSNTFRGTVARVARSMDTKTRTMAVELDVMNPDGRLAPGMYAEVRWPVRRETAALLVPKTSVVTTTERMFVIRVRNGKAEWVDVRQGAADKDLVEVLGDLKPGDEVVVRGTDEIRPAAHVSSRRTPPEG